MNAPHATGTAKATLAAGSALGAFFLALFAQFPRQEALPGNCDTLLAIALSNTYFNQLAALAGFGPAGMAMYPAGALMYGEKAPGIALVYSLFKLAGLGDVAAYYLVVTLIFALTGLAVFVFAGLFVRSWGARLFAGFAVACSNVMFTQIDDAVIWFYFFPLLALTYLARAAREDDAAWLRRAAVLGGLQIYFSMYVFVYQTILLTGLSVYILLGRRTTWPRREWLRSALLYAGIAAPLFATYIWAKWRLAIADPWDPFFLIRILSLTLADLYTALPGNLLYGGGGLQTWYLTRHQNLIGLLVVAAAAYALVRHREHRLVLGGLALAGLVLALGPELMLTQTTAPGVPAPLYPAYHWLPLAPYLRVPVRAYFLALLALSVLAAVTLDGLLARQARPRARAAILMLFFGVQFIENVPFPFTAYKLEARLKAPPEYAAYLAGHPEALVLDLPSDFHFAYDNWSAEAFADPYAFVAADAGRAPLVVRDVTTVAGSHALVFAYNRDMYYMIWQTQHHRNIVGGLNGYFPESRLVFDRWIKELPAERALRWLRKQGVTHIAYHREMIIAGDPEVMYGLETSPLLRKAVDGERSQLFEFVDATGPQHD
jgi:hypothetical protein